MRVAILLSLVFLMFFACGDERDYQEHEHTFPYLQFAQRSYLVGVMRVTNAQVYAFETYDDAIPPHHIFWRSSDRAIADIDQFGVITGISAGDAKIYAQYEGLIDSAFVVVIPEEICSIKIQPAEKYLNRGQSFNFNIKFFNFEGEEVFPTIDVVWESSNENIAYIGEDGFCQANNLGRAYVTATAFEMTDTALVNVIDYNPDGDILPLQIGNYWVYERQQTIGTETTIDTVTMIVSGDTTLITTEAYKLRWRKDGEFIGETRFVFKGDLGIYSAGYREADSLSAIAYSRPVLWRKFPAMLNDQYATYERYGTDYVDITVRGISTSFTTPGGNFNCFEYYTTNNIYSEEMSYFAPNIGKVGYLGFEGGRLRIKLALIDYRI